jgi:hypothetical protein
MNLDSTLKPTTKILSQSSHCFISSFLLIFFILWPPISQSASQPEVFSAMWPIRNPLDLSISVSLRSVNQLLLQQDLSSYVLIRQDEDHVLEAIRCTSTQYLAIAWPDSICSQREREREKERGRGGKAPSTHTAPHLYRIKGQRSKSK